MIHGPAEQKNLGDVQTIFNIELENNEGSLFKELQSGEKSLEEVIPILKKGVTQVRNSVITTNFFKKSF